ncbi:hypothetical protein B0I27_107121 [Arcticibacter pallidicorallinus]|uniref:Uncharacterized protein n=1 Tax=Arcticibacter pallidicorallinus TaxID=1259464 RepID=A0A2T0U0V5_9SPHI|nr:hypothetical protein [Arcticibacter pallidicorallinus]PRY51535.1 hypothetical protein B0I27_107121 [Arcticibacter pallidicorallinus]
MPGDRPQESKFHHLKTWLFSSWPGVIAIILTVLGSVFGAGFWAGSYITKAEDNNTIMNLRLDHQTELFEQKEKAKNEALDELRKEQEKMEIMYKMIEKSSGK